jgi:hypothetical protein
MFGWLRFGLKAENESLRSALGEALDTAEAMIDFAEELLEDRKHPHCMWDWISPDRLRTIRSYN